MVYSEFPVEQLARLASSPFQIGFARQAMRTLAPSDFIAFEATQDGLLMRAQNEDALAKPLTLLRDLYRDNLVLRHWAVVHDDLASREATLLEEHVRPSVCVLRAEAPLRKLLGYGEALAKLSGGTALHWIWLDRYVPMDDPPGGRAA